MNEMAREQDLDGIRNYLYQYGESLDRILPPHMAPICQNPVINGMASYYLSQARSEGIEVRADCELKGQLPVSDLGGFPVWWGTFWKTHWRRAGEWRAESPLFIWC